jgi:hypothetical protein
MLGRVLPGVGWMIAGTQAGNALEGQFDRLDSSGVLGDVMSGAFKGGGTGAGLSLLAGPAAPIAAGPAAAIGAAGGGLYGFLTGDRNEGENLRNETHDEILRSSREFDVLARQGYLTEDQVARAHRMYRDLVEEGGQDPLEAAEQTYGDLQFDILTPEERMERDLREAYEQDFQMMQDAMRYAAQEMAPMQRQAMGQFDALNAQRDSAMAGAPGPTQAAMAATNPSLDAAQAAVLQSLGNPMAHFMQPEFFSGNSRLAEQIMAMRMGMMPQDGGGGMGLGDLIAQGALGDEAGAFGLGAP